MTVEEARKVIDEMEAQGASKEEIAGAFYLLFRDDKIDSKQLEALVNLLGYELNEEFKNMPVEEQKENGYELTNDPKENVQTPPREDEPQTSTSSNNDDADNEDDEEKKADKLFNGGKDSSNDAPKSTSNDEDDEEKKAMKLFGR